MLLSLFEQRTKGFGDVGKTEIVRLRKTLLIRRCRCNETCQEVVRTRTSSRAPLSDTWLPLCDLEIRAPRSTGRYTGFRRTFQIILRVLVRVRHPGRSEETNSMDIAKLTSDVLPIATWS